MPFEVEIENILESATHLKCVPPLLPDLGEGLPNDGNIEVIPGHV